MTGNEGEGKPVRPSSNAWVVTWEAPAESDGEWKTVHRAKLPSEQSRFRLDTAPTGVRAWRAEVRGKSEVERRLEYAYNMGSSPPRFVGGLRAEGVGPSETVASGTVRYAWRTLFPKDFPKYDNNEVWQVFTQWHQGDPASGPVGNSPPIAFTVDADMLYVQLHSAPASVGAISTYVGDYLIGAIDRGEWHAFQVDITWSTDPAVGSVTVTHNGAAVKLKDGKFTYSGQTLFPGAASCPDSTIPAMTDCAYLKMGFYRKDVDAPQPFVVYHDDVKRLVKR